MDCLATKLRARTPGIGLYGLAPPKQSTAPEQLEAIVARQLTRLASLPIDGIVVYDIQDEGARIDAPRPFPFLPTLDPEEYASQYLERLPVQKVVYRCVHRDSREGFVRWLDQLNASRQARISVLVGAPSRHSEVGLSLTDAYTLARERAPELLLGGISIAERHARSSNEHERILAKTAKGCRFFVTQAVYDVTSTKSLLSDYAIAVAASGGEPMPIIMTFAPCGSVKTLAFMQWLGIAFPRWLENDLRLSADPLAKSLDLCERIFAEIWDYAGEKGIPIGVNVESVSIRKAEIEASVELLLRLRRMMGSRIEAGGSTGR